MIIIQTNSLPLHLKSAFFGFNKAEYRTSLVSKSLPIKNPIFATHSNSATKTMHNVFSHGIYGNGKCRRHYKRRILPGQIMDSLRHFSCYEYHFRSGIHDIP